MWLQIAKKGSANVSITLLEALDSALCYGRIDSQRKSYDADYYLPALLASTRKEAVVQAQRHRTCVLRNTFPGEHHLGSVISSTRVKEDLLNEETRCHHGDIGQCTHDQRCANDRAARAGDESDLACQIEGR